MDGDAQVVLHVEADAAAERTPAVVEHVADQAQADEQGQPGAQTTAVVDGGVVDDDLLHERQEAQKALADDGQHDRGRERAAVAAQVRVESTEPPAPGSVAGGGLGGSRHLLAVAGSGASRPTASGLMARFPITWDARPSRRASSSASSSILRAPTFSSR